MNRADIFNKIEGFDRDKGNSEKNWKKHEVTQSEFEVVFFMESNFIKYDVLHSEKESRYIIFGKSRLEKHLFIVFTIRNNKIRVISARKMNIKEKVIYENLKKNSEI